MSPTPRVEGKSLVYYVSSGGRKGLKIFKDNEDRTYFLNLLRQRQIENKLVFYAYALLQNQYALLMETPRSNLKQTMHQINSGFANHFNRWHKRRKKVFKDRYQCIVLDKKDYLAEVSCYLHLLPRKTRTAKSLLRYKWSSYPGYVNESKRGDWIDYDFILQQFKGQNNEASNNYRAHIDDMLKKRISSPFKGLKGSAILGNEGFKRQVHRKAQLARKEAYLKHEIALARKIKRLVKKNTGWARVFSRNAAIYFIKKYTDLNNKKICIIFNRLKGNSISQMSRRFRIAMNNDNSIGKTTRELEKQILQLIPSRK